MEDDTNLIRRRITPMGLFGLDNFRAFSFRDRRHAVCLSGKQKLQALKQKLSETVRNVTANDGSLV